MEASGIDLRVFKRAKTKEKSGRFFPHVVEPSFGSDRLVYTTLEYAHKTKEGRTLLSLPRDVAPIQLSIFPLVSKEGLPEKAKQLHQKLINEGFMVEYDESGSIGRRYARADEVGIPLGITIDYQTLEDDTVTLRDRDTWRQVRNKIEKLSELLHVYFDYKIEFKDLGHPIEK
jgi:glycyl-tRNA synthetase